MAAKGISARELYEALSASPQQRRKIADRIFRQLRDDGGCSGGGRSGTEPAREATGVTAKPLHARTTG